MAYLNKSHVPVFVVKVYRYFRKVLEQLKYAGSDVFCPICERTFKNFAPYLPTNRRNARCINCGSLERHRLQYLYLQNETDLFNTEWPLRVLHFAPEKVLYDKIKVNRQLEYTRCDFSPNSFEFLGISSMTKVDITNIFYASNSFDVILCNHVLEHIEDDQKAMSELFRVLDVGGWGIFQVPIRRRNKTTYEDFSITMPKARKLAFGQHDHVRVYGLDYVDRLAEAGFDVVINDYVKCFSEEECIKFGLNPREMIYLCRKN